MVKALPKSVTGLSDNLAMFVGAALFRNHKRLADFSGESNLRTNFVLIDFESVQPESLLLLSQEQFRILVFVGANQAKIPYDLAVAIQRMGDKAEYIKISGNGPNALDFHIAFYIGQLAAKEPTAYFHIISKDAGFDPLIQHLKSRQILSARSATIDGISLLKAGNAKSPGERAQLIVTSLQRPKATKPRTVTTLSSAIAAYFQKQVTEEEVAAVVVAMQNAGFISVTDGKVSYEPAA